MNKQKYILLLAVVYLTFMIDKLKITVTASIHSTGSL